MVMSSMGIRCGAPMGLLHKHWYSLKLLDIHPLMVSAVVFGSLALYLSWLHVLPFVTVDCWTMCSGSIDHCSRVHFFFS